MLKYHDANYCAEGHVSTENPGAKDSLAYIQLEKQNERLKEALIKFVRLI